MIGFETIGNATVICHDGRPVLATDPWLDGDSYFGSWCQSHPIPPEQMEHIRSADYLWFSHGHPDHLNPGSIDRLSAQKILLPNHYGGRIHRDLKEQGFNVRVLPDRKWVELSPNVKVMCIPDYFQDAVLLMDVKGVLVINTNDAADRGWGGFLRKVAEPFKTRFLLKLSGYGDADMINIFNEDGERVPSSAAEKRPPGEATQEFCRLYGAQYFVPFSSFHHYQREDSIWANEFTTPVEAYPQGFTDPSIRCLPPFIRYDCERDTIEEINPPAADVVVRPPSDFGDDWSEWLSTEDETKLRSYFQAKEALNDHFGFLRFRVGGRDTLIDLACAHRGAENKDVGITFEVPRHSLMTAVDYEVFDDLLIGNFMKTTLHNVDSLYPGFNPTVPKFADNGLAQTKAELRRYHLDYIRRAPVALLKQHFADWSEITFRKYVSDDTLLFQASKKVYRTFRPLKPGLG